MKLKGKSSFGVIREKPVRAEGNFGCLDAGGEAGRGSEEVGGECRKGSRGVAATGNRGKRSRAGRARRRKRGLRIIERTRRGKDPDAAIAGVIREISGTAGVEVVLKRRCGERAEEFRRHHPEQGLSMAETGRRCVHPQTESGGDGCAATLGRRPAPTQASSRCKY